MNLKVLSFITVLSLVCQIIFSIYYSTAIFDQNTLINRQQSLLDSLTIRNQQLEINLSSLNSLSTILDFTNSQNFRPVSHTIDLK